MTRTKTLVLAVVTAATSLGAVSAANPPAPEPEAPPDPPPAPVPNLSTDDLANAIEVAERARLEAIHQAELAAIAEAERQAAEAAAAQAAAIVAAQAEQAERSTRVPSAQAALPKQAAPVERSDIWWQLALCESGGNPATNTGNGYYGAFQFMPSTWWAVGGTGLPSEHSYDEQRARAQQLQARSGFRSQWPACSAKLGLL